MKWFYAVGLRAGGAFGLLEILDGLVSSNNAQTIFQQLAGWKIVCPCAQTFPARSPAWGYFITLCQSVGTTADRFHGEAAEARRRRRINDAVPISDRDGVVLQKAD